MAFQKTFFALLRLALIPLLLTTGGFASAYAPTTGWRLSFPTTCGGTSPTGYIYSSAAQACSQYLNERAKSEAGSCSAGVYGEHKSVNGGNQCVMDIKAVSGGSLVFGDRVVGAASSGSGCPNGGTLTGGNCVCPSTHTDTGTGCIVNDCPAAGTSLGVHNVTGAWALSPTPGASDYVGGSQTNFFPGSSQCVPEGSGHCSATVSPTGGGGCWRANAPSSSGLYRVSCDVEMTASGSACTVTSGSPTDPAAAPPACPTGNVGTVNGKPVCLGFMPTTGINLGSPGDRPGNPRAGSPATDNNTAREPNSGSGGGPDARGGPGVTNGFDGSVGTGSDRTAGSGNGNGESPGLELPTDYNREGTQQNIYDRLHDLKLNEDGTPNGDGLDTEAKDSLNTEAGKISTGLEGIVAGDGAPNRSWGFSVSFPTTCNPFSIGTARWGFFTLDFCQFQPVIHDLMSLIWIGATIFACLGMAGRAVTGGGA